MCCGDTAEDIHSSYMGVGVLWDKQGQLNNWIWLKCSKWQEAQWSSQPWAYSNERHATYEINYEHI